MPRIHSNDTLYCTEDLETVFEAVSNQMPSWFSPVPILYERQGGARFIPLQSLRGGIALRYWTASGICRSEDDPTTAFTTTGVLVCQTRSRIIWGELLVPSPQTYLRNLDPVRQLSRVRVESFMPEEMLFQIVMSLIDREVENSPKGPETSAYSASSLGGTSAKGHSSFFALNWNHETYTAMTQLVESRRANIADFLETYKVRILKRYDPPRPARRRATREAKIARLYERYGDGGALDGPWWGSPSKGRASDRYWKDALDRAGYFYDIEYEAKLGMAARLRELGEEPPAYETWSDYLRRLADEAEKWSKRS